MGCTIHGDAAITVTEGEVRVLLPPHLDNTVPPFVVIDPCLEHPRPDPLEVARSAHVEHLHTVPPFTLVAGNKKCEGKGGGIDSQNQNEGKGHVLDLVHLGCACLCSRRGGGEGQTLGRALLWEESVMPPFTLALCNQLVHRVMIVEAQ
jgi:hypothetical protein